MGNDFLLQSWAGYFMDKSKHPEQPNEYTFRWMNAPAPERKGST